jgi:hypothetical protein
MVLGKGCVLFNPGVIVVVAVSRAVGGVCVELNEVTVNIAVPPGAY